MAARVHGTAGVREGGDRASARRGHASRCGGTPIRARRHWTGRGATGVVASVPGARRDVDLVILPSYSEALPIVLLEAMAAGVPIVATDTGSCEEIVGRPIVSGRETVGPAGIIVPIRDAPALAAAMRTLMSDELLYR